MTNLFKLKMDGKTEQMENNSVSGYTIKDSPRLMEIDGKVRKAILPYIPMIKRTQPPPKCLNEL